MFIFPLPSEFNIISKTFDIDGNRMEYNVEHFENNNSHEISRN